MSERAQRTITVATLAGYLLTVTAALQVHRCQAHRASAERISESHVCGLCHASSHAPERSAPEGDVSAGLGIVPDAQSDAPEGDCFICQMLAQKHLLGSRPSTLGWADDVREPFAGEPRAEASTLPCPWHIRAPPRVA